jgi:serine/threonine protein kinase
VIDYTLVVMGNSPARMAIDVGSVIADTYTIEALIGRGGMGEVFLASHKRLPGKKVAIKLLHGGHDDVDILRRFAREAEIASKLGHPNIVGVVDTNQLPDGTPYLVLEYLQGESLAQRIKAGPIPLPQVLSIIRQVGSALAAAHREGIVHRDLKPQNIFLCPTEVDGRMIEIAKVLDFGISKIRGSDTVKTQESSLLGTPQYMAPEQATGQHSTVDERTDIFALGAIIYEMFTGYPAFSGASIPEVVFKVVYEQPVPLQQVAPDVPANVVAAVTKALAKPAQERFASVSELVEALTGKPLATLSLPPISPPDVGFADGSAHRPSGKAAGQDAFAQTMDSGKGDATPIPPTPFVPPHTSTVASLDSEAGNAKPPVFTSSIRQPASVAQRELEVAKTAAPVAIAPRSRMPMIAIAVGAAVLAAIVMFVVMRNDNRTPVVANVVIDAAAVDTQTAMIVDAGVVVVVADAAAPPGDGPPAPLDAPKLVRADAGPKPDKPPVEPEPPEDANLNEILKTAESALARNAADAAKKGANTVIDAAKASKRQLARAHGIRGSAACRTADLGDLKSDLAALTRLIRRNPAFAPFRARMLTYCHANNQLLELKR